MPPAQLSAMDEKRVSCPRERLGKVIQKKRFAGSGFSCQVEERTPERRIGVIQDILLNLCLRLCQEVFPLNKAFGRINRRNQVIGRTEKVID